MPATSVCCSRGQVRLELAHHRTHLGLPHERPDERPEQGTIRRGRRRAARRRAAARARREARRRRLRSAHRCGAHRSRAADTAAGPRATLRRRRIAGGRRLRGLRVRVGKLARRPPQRDERMAMASEAARRSALLPRDDASGARRGRLLFPRPRASPGRTRARPGSGRPGSTCIAFSMIARHAGGTSDDAFCVPESKRTRRARPCGSRPLGDRGGGGSPTRHS